jgi:hypothetical protein
MFINACVRAPIWWPKSIQLRSATAKASWKIRSLEPTADIELLKVDLGPDKSKEPDLRGRVLLLVSSKAINRSGDGGPS